MPQIIDCQASLFLEFSGKNTGGGLITQSCMTVCDPMDYSPPGSSVHGILQARVLEGVSFPTPGYLPYPRTEPASPALAGRFFPSVPPGKPIMHL